ncbi:hypothetical protein ACWDKQ_11555 [Saccharopolyspora sp. NPDC000995]
MRSTTMADGREEDHADGAEDGNDDEHRAVAASAVRTFLQPFAPENG